MTKTTSFILIAVFATIAGLSYSQHERKLRNAPPPVAVLNLADGCFYDVRLPAPLTLKNDPARARMTRNTAYPCLTAQELNRLSFADASASPGGNLQDIRREALAPYWAYEKKRAVDAREARERGPGIPNFVF